MRGGVVHPRVVICIVVITQNVWWMSHGASVVSGSSRPPPLIEGDIVLDEAISQITNANDLGIRTKRDAVANRIRLWPGGVVPYVIDSNIGTVIRKRIRRAFRHISKRSCIKFIPKMRKHRDYLHFINGNGCYSSIGRKGGAQIISLDRRDCEFGATHEVMHSLGFFHEQSRPDRDRHVKILWWNIQEGMESNFRSYPNSVTDTLNQPYDLGSIMHYGNKAFTKNGRETIVSRSRPWLRLGGQHKKLTKIDTLQLNKLYNCNVRERRHLGRGYCRNILSGCFYYAVESVACESNYYFMQHYCRRSCGFC